MNSPTTRRCPLTYAPLPPGQSYSLEGLKKLSPQLRQLDDLPLSAQELRIEARNRAHKISIQGVQPKLSARLAVKEARFEIVDIGGKFILKPPRELYEELPQNEDLSMRLAATLDIEVPLHGMLYNRDGSLTYFIKRFDRSGHKDKVAVEDFAQLSGKDRESKYSSSMEQLAKVLEQYSTFPVVEKRKLFIRALFNFLTGNEDMHLKNYSLIRRDGKVELAPAYDFLNTTILLDITAEETALSLRGKKKQLRKDDWVEYFGKERLGLNTGTVEEIMAQISKASKAWETQISESFLSKPMQGKYLELLQERKRILGV